MHTIVNPVLKGFNPDPSILRVGEDYYIATSTFEWFPGVAIHHSKDLVNWELLTYPLTRQSQLDMEGNINSGGVWAPCLSYSDGLFYLIYTDVKSRFATFKDTHNYLVTSPDIMGPWSEPIYLNSSGFDPSLFHDEDGRKWLVNMLWDYRKGKNSFAGIVLQEYSVVEEKLVGPIRNIFKGTELRVTEAPHLYKHNGYYYLMTAEGGTGYEHAVTMCRSKSLFGPYEVDPENPILTSVHDPSLRLQKAGHGSLVETQTGEWYLAHLCGRPVKEKFCTLGRETAIQRCYWDEEGWLRVEGGGPQVEVKAPNLEPHPFAPDPEKDDFNTQALSVHWNTLRVPHDESWLTLKERPGFLRLRGRESMNSTHKQSLVARRLQSFQAEIETSLEFNPDTFQQMAGLILYYDTEDYIYLRVSHDDDLGVNLGIIQSKAGVYDELLAQAIPLKSSVSYRLKAVVDGAFVSFFYGEADGEWQAAGELIDLTHLSDEGSTYIRFTGTYVGLCVQDLSGRMKEADFDYFIYKEK
ncbi:glycoside hydrolase family 43 protein [Pullulanibacillus sp. KACC 23026]|uniref:glycoside hydrolase family 43 protein n=1 Tax=Pullulanibacillus sp. KACC 23026 TaxID=3028315 RepID=UPI0023B01BF4|nr:glycoside hydrolase family 43 protein [Pullulanibacillus sp. KACC 23026]WEG12015.1 glycoside hydrolase family 43 protein [Pullulanibacillus sp. KACC 23026]